MSYEYRRVGYQDLTYKKKAEIKSKELSWKKRLDKSNKKTLKTNDNINSKVSM